ncbi:efflux RND transporter periplasmic adaptor subunit [Thalassotalea sp. M1531]|uniref:Efflux RND transporter periplasmic adaptor subunit n=1 Tax=Thalassotalea algicola TaxID=2716224 RepID=A0A7Y0L9T3_9GAMM|nr:efflux RND transporter periplasmic adaptor subunit [Thalassotalea algicola]NMP30284.1 efflux RND transporter periplasmic adaptor subunit [Thalassotalea algicola]
MNSENTLALMAKLLVVNSFLLLISACSESHSNETANNYVQTAQIEQVNRQPSYQIDRQYVGKISAKQQSNLSFEFAGRVLETLKDSGDKVKKGNILAVQDVELLNIKANEIRAQINQVDAQIELNKANYKRAKELHLSNYASEQVIDELTAEKSILTANKNGLKASYDALHYQISKATLRAPYDGVINQRLIAQGDLLSAATPAFTINNQNQQEVSLGIPAKVAKELAIDEELDVEINKKTYAAKIIAIGQQIDPATRTLGLRLKLTQPINAVSGLIARVSIKEHIPDSGFWLPLTAITDGVRGQWNIYTAVAQGNQFKILPETVKVLHTTKDSAYITGLTSNQISIITAGLHRYVPGQIVKAKGANE